MLDIRKISHKHLLINFIRYANGIQERNHFEVKSKNIQCLNSLGNTSIIPIFSIQAYGFKSRQKQRKGETLGFNNVQQILSTFRAKTNCIHYKTIESLFSMRHLMQGG